VAKKSTPKWPKKTRAAGGAGARGPARGWGRRAWGASWAQSARKSGPNLKTGPTPAAAAAAAAAAAKKKIFFLGLFFRARHLARQLGRAIAAPLRFFPWTFERENSWPSDRQNSFSPLFF